MPLRPRFLDEGGRLMAASRAVGLACPGEHRDDIRWRGSCHRCARSTWRYASWAGDHDLRVRVLEPLSAHYRVIQVTADDAQLRPCGPRHSVPRHGRLPATQRLVVVPRHALAHIPGPVLSHGDPCTSAAQPRSVPGPEHHCRRSPYLLRPMHRTSGPLLSWACPEHTRGVTAAGLLVQIVKLSPLTAA